MTYDPDNDPRTDFTVYNAAGDIISQGWTQRSVVEKMMLEGNCLPVASNALTQFVLNGEVLDKGLCPAWLDGLTLRDMPVPSQLLVDKTIYDVTEPTVELSFNLPGTYTIKIFSAPYLPVTLEVTV